jgi:hypothetical protein
MTAGWHDEDAPLFVENGYRVLLPGRVMPIAPDAARDERVDAYRDRERRRAAKALDRYIASMFTSAADAPQLLGIGANREAAGRFVEAVGDYVLARLGQTSVGGALPNVPTNDMILDVQGDLDPTERD